MRRNAGYETLLRLRAARTCSSTATFDWRSASRICCRTDSRSRPRGTACRSACFARRSRAASIGTTWSSSSALSAVRSAIAAEPLPVPAVVRSARHSAEHVATVSHPPHPTVAGAGAAKSGDVCAGTAAPPAPLSVGLEEVSRKRHVSPNQ